MCKTELPAAAGPISITGSVVLRRTVRKNLLMDFQEKERLCHQTELSIYLRENLGRKKKSCVSFLLFLFLQELTFWWYRT